jgi:phosphohistidine phosphatase
VDVYLVRHAFAAHADPDRWPDDSLRPVTVEGAERFRAAARGLRRVAPGVDVVLSSGFARSWQTAELLREEAGWPAPESCPELEAGRSSASAVDVLRRRTEEAIALVGHEPHLSRLASLLCTGDEGTLDLELKKGAVALLSIDDAVEPGEASLRWAAPPKLLRRLDRGH